MLQRLLLAAALAVGLSSVAQAQTAQVVPGCAGYSPSAGPGASIAVDEFGRLCGAVDTVRQGAAVYRGGTITTANTSQQLMAANPARRGWSVQNQSTGDLYVKVGQPATVSNFSLRIAPGTLYETPSQHVSAGVINIVGATAGQAFYSVEY